MTVERRTRNRSSDDHTVLVVRDRRDDRTARMWSALCELLLSVATLTAAASFTFDTGARRASAIHGFYGPPVTAAWILLLYIGPSCLLAGLWRMRPGLVRAGQLMLGVVAGAYAASLLPERGASASLAAPWFLALSMFLVARGSRTGAA